MVESIKELRRICQKIGWIYDKKKVDQPYWYIRFLRFVSIYFTKIFLHIGISANQVTLISIMIAIVGCFFFTYKNPFYWIVGFLFLQLFFFLDCADGEVARYNKTFSPIGRYFDLFAHGVVTSFTFGSMAWGIYQSIGSKIVFIFGFFAVASSLLGALSEALKKYHLFEYAYMKKSDIRIVRDIYPHEKDKKKEMKKYTINKIFSFFSIPFVILGVSVLDIIFKPLEIIFFGMINWRYFLLMCIAAASSLKLIKMVRSTLKLQEKFKI